jgi:fructokinase
MYDLVCFGEIVWDHYGNRKVLGGAPLNVASFAAAMGLSVALISAVSESELAGIQKEVEGRGVHAYVQGNEHPTGLVKITLDAEKTPRFDISRDSAFDYIQIDETLGWGISESHFFYFSTLCQRNPASRAALNTYLGHLGGTIVWDVNLRKGFTKDVLRERVEQVNVLKLSKDEMEQMQKITGYEIPVLFNKTNIKQVFLTDGERGATLYYPGGSVSAPAPNVKVVDTTGCGDAFTAAVILGLERGLSPKEMLEKAVEVASIAATFHGAYDPKEFKRLFGGV